MKKILRNLERNMYSHNYEAHFGIDILENCEAIDEIRRKLSLKYSDDRFDKLRPESANEIDLWSAIKYGFEYRGDNVAGLELSHKKEQELLVEQKKYEAFIQQYLTNSTIILKYPDEFGIPYLSVFWGYSFILFNRDGNSLFIYGLASD